MFPRLERLLAELKRRHVFRMIGIYAVGAWVVVQVSATTFPYLGLPEWTVTVVIVLAALGLPVTIALAWIFDLTTEGVQRDESAAAPAGRRGLRHARPAMGFLLILVVGFGAFTAIRRIGDATVDADLAAVMPFRVAGGDAGTAGLGEGMVDLLAMRLASARGVRAADARSAISAWARAGGDDAADPLAAARTAALSLGAGRVITGSVVVAGRRLTLGATLLRTDQPRAPPRAESVTGPVDSLLYLVDRLTLSLLAQEAGVEQHRLGGLTSLPALQAYLLGKAAHRRGQYAEAIAHFQQALEVDSAFALAALSLNISARRTPQQFELAAPAVALANRHRDRLSERDRALLRAFEPRFPAITPILEVITAFEEVLARWPDDADAWFELGDQLLHYGAASDIEDHVARAARAFDRARALDSSFYLPIEHRLHAALEQGDRAQVRALAPHIRAVGAAAARFEYLEWRIALALGDTAGVRAVAGRMDSVSTSSLYAIAGDAQWLGERLEDAERAVAIVRSRAATSAEIADAILREHDLALNRGQVRRAAALLAQLPPPTIRRDVRYVRDALLAHGDARAAQGAAARLRLVADAPPSDTTVPGWRRAQLGCELGWWELERGNLAAAAAFLERLRAAAVTAESPFSADDAAYCTTLTDAWIATVQQRSDARVLLERADSINIYSSTGLWNLGNIITARLQERRGDARAALTSWRRVLVAAPDIAGGYVAVHLHGIGRLADETGNRALAREYYRRYLGLRAAADPELQAQVADVRERLARLSREGER